MAISIHALREEGDGALLRFVNIFCQISIHALREEGDWTAWSRAVRRPLFLSTPSVRRATLLRTPMPVAKARISIHALREEGDCLNISTPA